MNNEFHNQNNNTMFQNNNNSNNNINQNNISNNISDTQYQNQNPTTQSNMQTQENTNNSQNINNNPNYNYQPYQTGNSQVPNKKNNKLIIIIVIIAMAIIIAVLLALLLFNNMQASQNINEYEEDNNNNISNIQDDNVNDDTITVSGFEFKKISGYYYEQESGVLVVNNSEFAMNLQVVQVSFDGVKTEEFQNEFKNLYEEHGYTIGNIAIETISGKEVLVTEVLEPNTGIKGLAYITEAASNFVFTGFVVNRDNTHNHNDIKTVLTITSNSEYVGGYTGYSKDLDEEIKIPKVR